MKIKSIVLSAILLVVLPGCEQKADLAAKASETGKDVTQKIQESAQQASKEITQKAQESAQKVTSDAAKAAKKSVVVVKETAEQALVETAGRAREITKTQKSESRQHGQKAEDEMMMELEKKK